MVKHGAPDWSKYQVDSKVYPTLDFAEIPPRLGSPVTFDRRGNVYYLDSFEHGLRGWAKVEIDSGDAVDISPADYRTGGYSVKLVNGQATISQAGLRMKLPLLAAGKVGFSVAWRSPPGVPRFWIRMFWYSETVGWEAMVECEKAGGKVKLAQLDPIWTELATGITFYPSVVSTPWHVMKLVADFDTGYYTRLLLDRDEWDISSYPLLAVAVLAKNTLAIDFTAAGDNTTTYYTYVDDVIITQDEP